MIILIQRMETTTYYLDAPHEWNDNCAWEENNWNDYSKKDAFIQVIKHRLLKIDKYVMHNTSTLVDDIFDN